jgi:hypothetical protein
MEKASGQAAVLRQHLVIPQDAEGGTLEACAPQFLEPVSGFSVKDRAHKEFV